MARTPRKKKLIFTKGEVAELPPAPPPEKRNLASEIFPNAQPATAKPAPASAFDCSMPGCAKPARQWEATLRSHFLTPTCSQECLQRMIEEGVCGYEYAAMKATSPIAGRYLERINKFDLRTMTPGEWTDFIELVCMTYHSEVNMTHMKALVRAATPTSDEMASSTWDRVAESLKKAAHGKIEDDEIPF